MVNDRPMLGIKQKLLSKCTAHTYINDRNRDQMFSVYYYFFHDPSKPYNNIEG